MKKRMLLSMLSLAAVVNAAPANLDKLDNELEIMSGVIDTALKQNNTRKGMGYRSVDTTYLSRQGVVFTVHTRGSSGLSLHLGEIFSAIPEAPVPPVTIVTGGDYEFEVGHEWEAFAENVEARVAHAFRESGDQLRELRSRERELAWEKRELERRMRDLEFEKRQADGEREKDIDREINDVKEEMKGFAKKEKELEEYTSEIEKEQRQKLNERKEAQEQAYKQFLAGFENSIGDTLCRFGAGLRGLPDRENITFVLKDFSKSDNRKHKDRVYVFSKSDVVSCVQEKTDASELLSAADVYEF